jgi:RNase P/RNase MRP subunit p29
LHVTERLRRRDFGHMEIDKTFDDPKALAKPLSVPVKLELDADTEMIEYVCAENERDRGHLVGKVTDETKNEVKVAPEILAKYAGVYDFKVPERPGLTIVLTVALDGDRLMVAMDGGVKRPLTPLSETKFFFLEAGGNVEFAKNDKGAVTEMIIGAVEGTFKAIRRSAP